MSLARAVSSWLPLSLTLAALGCSPPRPEGGAPGSSTKTVAAGQIDLAVVTGSPDARALGDAVETDVPGELTMKVPGAWIAQTSRASGHAYYTSRDGRVIVAVTDNGASPIDDAALSRWLARPWLEIATPTIGTFRPVALGRSGIAAEIATGSGKRSAGGQPCAGGQPNAEPIEIVAIRFPRQTARGASHVLVNVFAAESAARESRAEARAMVRSLGTR